MTQLKAFIKNNQFQITERRQPQAWEPWTVWICMGALSPEDKVESCQVGRDRQDLGPKLERWGSLQARGAHQSPGLTQAQNLEFQLGMSLGFLVKHKKVR